VRWQIQSIISNNSPDKGTMRMASFVIHAVRGAIRDQNRRRKTMFILLVVALAMLFSGSTFFESALNPRERPVWFILFWVACAWLTLTAMLLAIFDLLVVKLEARKTGRMLREKFSQAGNADSPMSRTGE
jgi:protein-S-isoprenylcysteine O-methyltransferase Ste14